MLRYILLGALIYFVIKLVRSIKIITPNKEKAKPQLEADELVKCTRCNVYVSKSTAVMQKGEWRCGDDRCK